MAMSETEYELLDELYFLKSFEQLQALFSSHVENLPELLFEVYKKGWVKILDADEGEIQPEDTQFWKEYEHYRYNASKKGLMAHNSI